MFVRRAVSEQLKQTDRHTQRIAYCTIVALTIWILLSKHNSLGLKNDLILVSGFNTNFLNLFSNSMGVAVNVIVTLGQEASKCSVYKIA